jgi:hypothetical protein
MLPSGFEPESPARKAGMIGRTTLREHFSGSPDQIRTGVAGSKGQNVNHYTTGLLQDLCSEYGNII